MADPLKKVTPGEPLPRGPSARLHNDLVDLVAAWKAGRLGGAGARTGAGRPPALEVLVRNDTGADRDRGDVLAVLDEIVVDPAELPFDVQARPVFAADLPAATTDPVVILSEPIPDGQMGRAVIAGVAVTRIDGEGDFGTPTAGQTYLTAASSGPARVLQNTEEDDPRTVTVLLGGGGGGGASFKYALLIGVCDASGNVIPAGMDCDTETCDWKYIALEVVLTGDNPRCPVFELADPLFKWGPGAGCVPLSNLQGHRLPVANDWADDVCDEATTFETITEGTIHPWFVHRVWERDGGWFFDSKPLVEGIRPTGESDAYGNIGFVRVLNPATGLWEDGEEVRWIDEE